jgi:DNA ligase-1
MALFRNVADLAEKLAGEAGRLKKRAAIAEAISLAHAEAPEAEDSGLLHCTWPELRFRRRIRGS